MPSPKLPTRRSPPKIPKVVGAMATPQGALRLPPGETARETKLPFVSKTLTMPLPAAMVGPPVAALESVGDEDLRSDGVDGVRHVAGGKIGISEGTCEFGNSELVVVDLDRRGLAEVGGEQEGAGRVGDERQAGVYGSGSAIVDDDLCDGARLCRAHCSNP